MRGKEVEGHIPHQEVFINRIHYIISCLFVCLFVFIYVYNICVFVFVCLFLRFVCSWVEIINESDN